MKKLTLCSVMLTFLLSLSPSYAAKEIQSGLGQEIQNAKNFPSYSAPNAIKADFEKNLPPNWAISKRESKGQSSYLITQQENATFNLLVSLFDLTMARTAPKSIEELKVLMKKSIEESNVAYLMKESEITFVNWGDFGTYFKMTDPKAKGKGDFKYMYTGAKVIDQKMYIFTLMTNEEQDPALDVALKIVDGDAPPKN